ncbi:putative mannose-sensitive agglutinin (MSHA) biogenesis protein MshI [Methylotenera mobilis JLW8]|uniref:Putative mannose-sensitive agglutinin (MSHA) biogenesis protein MshI n=2 Tax=Methylotenera mobilis TaxID=359408 RepID=C6WW11_METML|nr:putative mannose-sensitive agglutinin (MSHA) biogenesis protein MshI [Methylotenera mobilis JLW8]
MSQQINLVNLALIKQKQFLTLNSIAVILGVITIAMLTYYAYVKSEVNSLSMQRQQVANELIKIQTELKAITALHMPRDKDNALEKQIEALEESEKIHQKILNTLRQSSNMPTNSYAALMRAFAKQNIEGLWLTGFSVDSQTDTLNIQGRALRGDLVPQYINGLSNEPALKGKLFSGLNISMPKVASTQTQTTQNKPEAEKSNTKNTLTITNEPNYIEFSLESKFDNTSAATASTPLRNTNTVPMTGGNP